MNVRRTRLAASLLAFAAGSAHAADRYWVAPLIGTWTDAANWALTSGGPGGFGVPLSGDDIFLDTRSITIFNGAGIPNPQFASLTLTGPTGGNTVTSLSMASGSMFASEVSVGFQSPRCELLVTNATLTSDLISIGLTVPPSSGLGGGLLNINGAGLVESTTVVVGELGTGTVEIQSGTLRTDDLTLATRNGEATLNISGGLLDAMTMLVGDRGDAAVIQSGGTILADSYVVGTSVDGPFGNPAFVETSTHTGGVLDAGIISVGVGDGFANGRLVIDGADVHASTFRLGLERGRGIAELSAGTLDVAGIASIGGFVQASSDGSARLTQTGGVFNSTTLDIGSGGLVPAPTEMVMSGGFGNHGNVRVGTRQSSGADLTIEGPAQFNADTLTIALAPQLNANVRVTGGGTLSADTIRLGTSDPLDNDTGSGRLTVSSDGTVTADLIQVFGSSTTNRVSNSGGTINAEVFVVQDEFDAFGGVTTAGTLISGRFETQLGFGATPDVQIQADADVRTPEFRHGFGTVEFGPGTPIVSGVILGPPFNSRTLGTWNQNTNGAALIVTAEQGALFEMHLNLGPFGSIMVEPGAVLPVGGTLTSLGDITLVEGTISSPNPIALNAGLVTGVGTFDADVTHNAQLEPLQIDITGTMTCQPDAVTRFTVGTTGSTTLSVGADAALDGTIEIDIIGEQFLPPPGAEYELIAAPNGTVSGTFVSEVFTGASVPAELVYEPDRVLLRVLYCSRADVAEPFGVINFFDIVEYLALYDAGDPIADVASPFGTLNFFDLAAYIALFNAGCP